MPVGIGSITYIMSGNRYKHHRVLLIVSAVIFSVFISVGNSQEVLLVGLRPLGPFDADLIDVITSGVAAAYPDIKVTVLPEVPIPAGTFYRPRNRYRAERVLDYLDSTAISGITKTVGLTVSDISTTKGEHEDWGIFGLGRVGGSSCVVSTFRLRSGDNATIRLKKRAVKTVIHELGHTFGLDHCLNGNCIMADACGSIRTIDESWNDFCNRCRKLIDIMVRLH